MKYLQSYKLFESKVLGTVQKFKYKIYKIEPIENLVKYKNHRRLKVFYHKGTKCVNYDVCGREGSIITHSVDNGGSKHIDVCTSDFYPMTIDHIIPKSKGGSNKLDNLDPMCSGCNGKKGNIYNGEGEGNKSGENYDRKRSHLKGGNIKKRYNIEIGDIVYKKISHKYLGKVIDIKPNPYHPNKSMAVQIEELDPKSLYNLHSLYKIDKI